MKVRECMTVMHKHHIVPRYRCEELGIDPDFEENIVKVTREQHAMIHWGYRCGDLEPLLEVCDPSPEILEMIAFGDTRDTGAAVLLAQGEIDGINTRGENNPRYKHGLSKTPEYKQAHNQAYYEENKEKIKEYKKKYHHKNKEKVKENKKEYYQKNKEKLKEKNKQYREENKEKTKEYYQKNKEYKKEYYQKNKERIKEEQRQYRAKKEAEVNGFGLDKS